MEIDELGLCPHCNINSPRCDVCGRNDTRGVAYLLLFAIGAMAFVSLVSHL